MLDGCIIDFSFLFAKPYSRRASAKDAAMKAFSGQIMPILKEQTAFTMDEGFELNNFAS